MYLLKGNANSKAEVAFWQALALASVESAARSGRSRMKVMGTTAAVAAAAEFRADAACGVGQRRGDADAGRYAGR